MAQFILKRLYPQIGDGEGNRFCGPGDWSRSWFLYPINLNLQHFLLLIYIYIYNNTDNNNINSNNNNKL